VFGFEAIAAHNGWAMALAGALIVMSGLAVLSLVISQLHKILNLLEYRKRNHEQTQNGSQTGQLRDNQKLVMLQRSAEDIMETATLYKRLVEQLGPSFQLSELYEASNKHGLPHPHLTIKSLREAGILIPQGDGVFSWSPGTQAS
jgi:hypothetical protein